MRVEIVGRLDQQRLERLIAVGRNLLGELRVEHLLQQLLETARELTGARYAALGIADDEHRALARFITSGVDEETQRVIGDLPHGRGILGVLIDDPRPLRLDDVTRDPRSYGFPIGHPPMASFLGVPVTLPGEAWGNLYLTEKAGGEAFTDADEASMVVLSDWAAVAIKNARLHETQQRHAKDLERAVRSLEATTAIATAVGAETDLSAVLELVVKRARALIEARSVLVLLCDDGHLHVTAAAGQVVDRDERLEMAGGFWDAVLDDRTVMVDDADRQPGLDCARLGVPDASTALLVPLTYRRQTLGVLCAFDRMNGPASFDHEDEQVLRAFAASAATAVATAKSVESRRLRAAFDSSEAERRRWARELHDETLQALGGLKILLAGAARHDDPERLRSAATEGVGYVSEQIDNLRALIAELRPASLDTLGLGPAMQTMVDRLGVSEGFVLDATIALDAGRLDASLETAVYRVAQESLTNISKHADAGHVTLRLEQSADEVSLFIADDGVGFDATQDTSGFGLLGMQERLELVGGRLAITSIEHGGTEMCAYFPLVRH